MNFLQLRYIKKQPLYPHFVQIPQILKNATILLHFQSLRYGYTKFSEYLKHTKLSMYQLLESVSEFLRTEAKSVTPTNCLYLLISFEELAIFT